MIRDRSGELPVTFQSMRGFKKRIDCIWRCSISNKIYLHAYNYFACDSTDSFRGHCMQRMCNRTCLEQYRYNVMQPFETAFQSLRGSGEKGHEDLQLPILGVRLAL